jgi:predicted nucleic acid-binding Zn ribbon protein
MEIDAVSEKLCSSECWTLDKIKKKKKNSVIRNIVGFFLLCVLLSISSYLKMEAVRTSKS